MGLPRSALQYASSGALTHPGQLPPAIALPSLAQAPVAGAACAGRAPPPRSAWRWSSGPGVGRLIGPERAVERGLALQPPLGGFGRAVESRLEALRTVARAWASDKAELEDDRARASSAPPGGWAAARAETRRRGLMEAAGLSLAGPGYRGSLEQAKGAHRQRLKGRAGAWSWGGEMSLRAFMGLRAAIGNFNGFWRLLPWPPATTDTWVLGLWSKPIACYGGFWRFPGIRS